MNLLQDILLLNKPVNTGCCAHWSPPETNAYERISLPDESNNGVYIIGFVEPFVLNKPNRT